jgi:uncharacterized YccA/Bax inhibitor family protein
MANPTLAPKRLNATLEELEPGWAAPGGPAGPGGSGGPGGFGTAPPEATSTRRMTVGGTFAKSFVLWVLLVAAGTFGWSQTDTAATQTQIRLPGFFFIAVLVAFGLAMLTIFRPRSAFISAPLYAIAEGVALGAISKVYDTLWNGIVLQAVLATVATFLACLFLYSFDIVKVTNKFRAVVITATFGIFLMYGVTFLLSLFGVDALFWAEPSTLGIVISIGICVVAALNLFLDFDMIRRLSVAGAPKPMEWYGAFGLTVTLVWLYLEILRLLSYLRN